MIISPNSGPITSTVSVHLKTDSGPHSELLSTKTFFFNLTVTKAGIQSLTRPFIGEQRDACFQAIVAGKLEVVMYSNGNEAAE